MLRGIRAISDYEYEFQMALMNRRLAPESRRFFSPSRPAANSFISSRMLKEVFSLGRRHRPGAPNGRQSAVLRTATRGPSLKYVVILVAAADQRAASREFLPPSKNEDPPQPVAAFHLLTSAPAESSLQKPIRLLASPV